MREIKFRAWNGKAMEYGGFSIHATGKTYIHVDTLTEVKPDSPMMQYTGLKDKNGKEIYEGDIVEYVISGDRDAYIEINGDIKPALLVIVWLGSAWGFAPAHPSLVHPDDVAPKGFYDSHGDDWDAAKMEINGNIYANPELLEGNHE